MWSFMDYNLVPDIVCIGKGLGNGYPVGAVVCNRDISGTTQDDDRRLCC